MDSVRKVHDELKIHDELAEFLELFHDEYAPYNGVLVETIPIRLMEWLQNSTITIMGRANGGEYSLEVACGLIEKVRGFAVLELESREMRKVLNA